MNSPFRTQLTLFVPEPMAGIIEAVRQRFNPLQAALIRCHVTLCREDEITDIEKVIQNLEQLKHASLQIGFGELLRFDSGKGLLMPAVSGQSDYQALRKLILSGLVAELRIMDPHITLMHPRNSTCTDDSFAIIAKTALPSIIHFNQISLIRQLEGAPWQVLRTFSLTKD